MANRDERLEENVAGKFYVDAGCIACDACVITAPQFFKINEEKGYAFTYKQPEDKKGEALCKEAIDGCPVEVIGSDGEE